MQWCYFSLFACLLVFLNQKAMLDVGHHVLRRTMVWGKKGRLWKAVSSAVVFRQNCFEAFRSGSSFRAQRGVGLDPRKRGTEEGTVPSSSGFP